MSKVCAVTGKKALSGNRRSHSLRATRRKWNVNLQNVTLLVDGKPTKVRVSARALRTLKARVVIDGKPQRIRVSARALKTLKAQQIAK